jgi:hypothetical protein
MGKLSLMVIALLQATAWAAESEVVRLEGSVHGTYCTTLPPPGKGSCVVVDNFPEPFEITLTGDPGYLTGEKTLQVSLGPITAYADIRVEHAGGAYEFHVVLRDSANLKPTGETNLMVRDPRNLGYLNMHGHAALPTASGQVDAHYIFGMNPATTPAP